MTCRKEEGYTALCGLLISLCLLSSITHAQETSPASLGTNTPATAETTVAGCTDSQFESDDGLMLTCHCKGSCGCCTAASGCQLCNDKQQCAVGYTGFPACQTNLATPESSVMITDSSQNGSVTFVVEEDLTDAPAGAQYEVLCAPTGDTDDRSLSCLSEVELFDECIIMGFLKKPYGCTITLKVDDDRSRRSDAFQIRACYGWEDIPTIDMIKVTPTLDLNITKDYTLDVYIPGVNSYCSQKYLTFDIGLFTAGKIQNLATKQYVWEVDNTYDLSNMRMQPNTSYELSIEATGWLDEPEILLDVSIPFDTEAVMIPAILNDQIDAKNTLGRLDVSFPEVRDINTGYIQPDEYLIQYREVKNDSFIKDWVQAHTVTREDGLVQASIDLKPEVEYQLRIVSVATISGVKHTNSSQVIKIDAVQCQAPSDFDFDTPLVKAIGTADEVVLRIYYTVSEPNCGGETRYLAKYKASDTLIISQDCQTFTECDIRGLKPITEYTLQIVAINSANKTAKTEYHTVVTGEKTPLKVENVSFDLSKKPNVIVSWKSPSIKRSNEGVHNYSIDVSETEHGDAIANATVITETKFSFTGNYYKDYTVKIRGANVAGYGLQETEFIKIPAAIPGPPASSSIVALNQSCVNFTWTKPNFDGGIILDYKVQCVLIETHSNSSIGAHSFTHKVLMTEKSRTLDEKVCGLIPGSQYDCSVAASNDAGTGDSSSSRLWTAPDKPVEPGVPVVIAEDSTDTTVTVKLQRADRKDQPVKFYYIGVEPITESSSKSIAKRQVTVDTGQMSSVSFISYREDSQARYITAKLSQYTKVFEIGDGEIYGGYYNAPLIKGRIYLIYYGVEVTRGGFTEQSFTRLESPIEVKAAPTSSTVIVAVVSSVVTIVVVLVICVVLLLIYRWRRGGLCTSVPTAQAELIPLKRRRAMHSKSPDSESANGGVVPEFKPISVNHLRSYVSTHQSEITKQYEALPKGFLAPCTAATDHDNKVKNRFANILPYDHSRVTLSKIDGDDGSDYINASYIDGYHKPSQYIAASGPRENTISDFWAMIWEHKVTCIVMVTKCIEEGKPKCERYWPEDRESERHGSLTVTNTSNETWADFTMKTFTIKKSGEAARLTCHHFHFLSWPDHGVPRHSTPFLLFRRKVRAFTSGLSSPLVIHCSAGVGRTGTFIAIDYLLDQAAQEGEVNVYHLVQSMRNQRVSMVQTLDQYHYIYHAVCEALESSDFFYSAPQFQDNFLTWSEEGVLEHQFEVLTEILEIDQSNFETGKEKENKTRNQNPSILPHDYHRAHIISQPTGYPTYINAIFINSYRKKDLFIVTQQPLAHTVDDYLRLIYDQHINTVVCMESDINTNPRYGVYMPETIHAPVETDLFTVTMTEVNDTRADIVVADITLTYKQAQGDSTHTFRQFQARFWSHDSPLPEDMDTFITLLEQVEKWQQMTDCGSVCVQCRDGNERSSILLSVWNSLDRLKTEQEVDVYHTVELIRMIRPQAITDTMQYKFIYEMLYVYLQEFDLYANYK